MILIRFNHISQRGLCNNPQRMHFSKARSQEVKWSEYNFKLILTLRSGGKWNIPPPLQDSANLQRKVGRWTKCIPKILHDFTNVHFENISNDMHYKLCVQNQNCQFVTYLANHNQSGKLLGPVRYQIWYKCTGSGSYYPSVSGRPK